VGTAAVQLAVRAGATVIGTSRTPDKLERAAPLGLTHGVLADERWPERVLELTGGRGVDVILDLVGGPYLSGNLKAIAERGRWIVVGVTGGASAPMDLRALMGRRASITGTVLRARPAEEKMALAREFEARVVPLFEKGVLRPVLERAFAAEQAGEAHGLLEENRTFGKLLLTWGAESA
jgi:NADPH:quinone reductase-like Zn-dependent oxidoreductase